MPPYMLECPDDSLTITSLHLATPFCISTATPRAFLHARPAASDPDEPPPLPPPAVELRVWNLATHQTILTLNMADPALVPPLALPAAAVAVKCTRDGMCEAGADAAAEDDAEIGADEDEESTNESAPRRVKGLLAGGLRCVLGLTPSTCKQPAGIQTTSAAGGGGTPTISERGFVVMALTAQRHLLAWDLQSLAQPPTLPDTNATAALAESESGAEGAAAQEGGDVDAGDEATEAAPRRGPHAASVVAAKGSAGTAGGSKAPAFASVYFLPPAELSERNFVGVFVAFAPDIPSTETQPAHGAPCKETLVFTAEGAFRFTRTAPGMGHTAIDRSSAELDAIGGDDGGAAGGATGGRHLLWGIEGTYAVVRRDADAPPPAPDEAAWDVVLSVQTHVHRPDPNATAPAAGTSAAGGQARLGSANATSATTAPAGGNGEDEELLRDAISETVVLRVSTGGLMQPFLLEPAAGEGGFPVGPARAGGRGAAETRRGVDTSESNEEEEGDSEKEGMLTRERRVFAGPIVPSSWVPTEHE